MYNAGQKPLGSSFPKPDRGCCTAAQAWSTPNGLAITIAEQAGQRLQVGRAALPQTRGFLGLHIQQVQEGSQTLRRGSRTCRAGEDTCQASCSTVTVPQQDDEPRTCSALSNGSPGSNMQSLRQVACCSWHPEHVHLGACHKGRSNMFLACYGLADLPQAAKASANWRSCLLHLECSYA